MKLQLRPPVVEAFQFDGQRFEAEANEYPPWLLERLQDGRVQTIATQKIFTIQAEPNQEVPTRNTGIRTDWVMWLSTRTTSNLVIMSDIEVSQLYQAIE